MEPAGLRLSGATVIDGLGPAIEDAVVDMEGGHIVAIATRVAALSRPDLAEHDLTGRFLMPGLIDAHVHVALTPVTFARASDPMRITDLLLRSFVRHGVTSVRDPGTPDQGAFYKELRTGRPEWPRFFSSGPVIDGPPGVHWSGTRIVETADEARHGVKAIADGGADLIKTYFWLRPETFAAVVEAAHDAGLPVAYHPGSVRVSEAIRIGVDQIEHMLHAPELLPAGDRDRAASLPGVDWDSLQMFRLWRHVDPASDAARALVDQMAEAGTVLTPTLALSAAVLRGPTGRHADGGRGFDMPADVQRRWEDTSHPEQYGPEDLAEAETIVDRQLEHVRLARGAGVRLAAGTGGMGHFLVPGASLLDELELLVLAGLSPREALTAATKNAAELVGRGDEVGSLAVGARADLVVLDADPSVDIANVRRQSAVLKDGIVVSGELSTPEVLANRYTLPAAEC